MSCLHTKLLVQSNDELIRSIIGRNSIIRAMSGYKDYMERAKHGYAHLTYKTYTLDNGFKHWNPREYVYVTSYTTNYMGQECIVLRREVYLKASTDNINILALSQSSQCYMMIRAKDLEIAHTTKRGACYLVYLLPQSVKVDWNGDTMPVHQNKWVSAPINDKDAKLVGGYWDYIANVVYSQYHTSIHGRVEVTNGKRSSTFRSLGEVSETFGTKYEALKKKWQRSADGHIQFKTKTGKVLSLYMSKEVK